MYDKMFTIAVHGLQRNLAVTFGKDNAELILTHFITGIIEATDFSLSHCIIKVMGPTAQLQAAASEINNTLLISELVYNITTIQQTDIIFSWQLCNQILFFNMGKRHGDPVLHI